MGGSQIAESYNFLTDDVHIETDYSEPLPYDEFTKKFTLDSKTNFRLSYHSEKSNLEEIYLKLDGKLYMYDCILQILYLMSLENIINILDERMNVS